MTALFMLLSEYSIVVSHLKYSLNRPKSKEKLPTVCLQLQKYAHLGVF